MVEMCIGVCHVPPRTSTSQRCRCVLASLRVYGNVEPSGATRVVACQHENGSEQEAGASSPPDLQPPVCPAAKTAPAAAARNATATTRKVTNHSDHESRQRERRWWSACHSTDRLQQGI